MHVTEELTHEQSHETSRSVDSLVAVVISVVALVLSSVHKKKFTNHEGKVESFAIVGRVVSCQADMREYFT
jgi:hypothetical protein